MTIHTVKVVKVTNPKTGQEAIASFDDSSDTVEILYNGFHFESEAYHLDNWALSNGYIIKFVQVDVEI